MKSLRLNLGCVIAFTLVFSAAVQPQTRSNIIDAFLKSEMTRLHIPGMSVVVQKSGKTVHESHLGYSNVELNAPVNEHSAFSIASMSKIYTAAAVHMLAEQGKLSLDESVRKYLKDAPETWEAITLQHLINHQSGFDDDWGFHDDWENTHKSIIASAKSNREFLDVHYKHPLLFEPGTGLKYAGGTFVLGVVIEQVTEKSYARFMHENVFEPLGLRETWVDDPLAIIPNRAAGYLYENEKLTNGHRLSPVALARGDVSIRASATDIAKFLSALREGRLVKEPARMFEYGRKKDGSLTTRSNGGWFTWFMRGSETRDHGGNYRSGFSSIMIEFVDDDLTVIVLSNLADVDNFSIAQKIASDYRPIYQWIREMPRVKNSFPTSKYLKALRAVGARRHDKSVLHQNFPMGMYEHLGDRFKEVPGVSFVARADMTSENRLVFGVPLKEIVFVQFGKKYTGIYIAPDGKILFIELPEG